MTINAWLRTATAKLTDAGILSARLDSIILLEDELAADRSWLLAHDDKPLTKVQAGLLNKKVASRAKHIPLAYIRGRSQFYGREFVVNEHVLVPRPESESIISLLKSATLDVPQPTIIDVGTGSGALAITAKLELPSARVYGVDIDKACLTVAQRNSAALQADTVIFYESDLLQGLQRSITSEADVLLANLPYVPDSLEINRAASHEPRLAIFGGDDGLGLFRRLFSQLAELGAHPSHIISEALPSSHLQLADMAASFGYRLDATDGFAQRFV